MARSIQERAPLAPSQERWAALVVAFILIVARSFVFTAYEQTFFDSDQAITGLMAKHLSEGRAFPLFMYGQPYLLAVEAWLAVPVFWIAGPTVAALRTSLILTNAATAALIILGLERWGGLRPAYGLAAAMFFCFPPPFLSSHLVGAGGGNLLPLLFVLIAWPLRARPIWLGVVLAIGFLVREFTLAVVPVLLAGQIWTRTVLQPATWKRWLIVAVTFVGVTAGVHQLRAFADPLGPGTRGQQVVWSDSTQIDSLRHRLTLQPAEMPRRAWAFVTERLPELLGGRGTPSPVGPWGHRWIAWLLGLAAVVACARVLFLRAIPRHDDLARHRDSSFALYMIGIGVVGAGVYIATRPVDSVVHRYFLLAVFIPVGLTALWLTVEPRRHLRHLALACVAAWAVSSGVDNWRYLAPWLSGLSRIRQGKSPMPWRLAVSGSPKQRTGAPTRSRSSLGNGSSWPRPTSRGSRSISRSQPRKASGSDGCRTRHALAANLPAACFSVRRIDSVSLFDGGRLHFTGGRSRY